MQFGQDKRRVPQFLNAARDDCGSGFYVPFCYYVRQATYVFLQML